MSRVAHHGGVESWLAGEAADREREGGLTELLEQARRDFVALVADVTSCRRFESHNAPHEVPPEPLTT